MHRAVNDKREHIPPVLSADVACFPFEISLPSETGSAFGLDMLKRMLKADPPAMM